MPPQERPWGGRGPEVDPSSCPPAHSALLSDTCIDLTGRYGHRLAALLSTAAPSTSLCLQTKAGQHRLHLMGGLRTAPTPPQPHSTSPTVTAQQVGAIRGRCRTHVCHRQRTPPKPAGSSPSPGATRRPRVHSDDGSTHFDKRQSRCQSGRSFFFWARRFCTNSGTRSMSPSSSFWSVAGALRRQWEPTGGCATLTLIPTL